MKKMIFANFKMNFTVQETKAYFTKFLCRLNNPNIQMVVCPAYTSLSVANFFLHGTDVKLGAQNISEEESTNQTGEISGRMLKDAGVEYVLVGHPERRAKFRETNLVINKKIKAALKQGIKSVLYIGETHAEKTNQKTAEVLKKQVEECLKGLYENELESIVIVYEPIWATTLSLEPSVKDIENGAKIIRKAISDNYSEKAGRDIVLIYGGGLKLSNFSKLLSAKGIDGAMFGSASIDAESFASIVNKIK